MLYKKFTCRRVGFVSLYYWSYLGIDKSTNRTRDIARVEPVDGSRGPFNRRVRIDCAFIHCITMENLYSMESNLSYIKSKVKRCARENIKEGDGLNSFKIRRVKVPAEENGRANFESIDWSEMQYASTSRKIELDRARDKTVNTEVCKMSVPRRKTSEHNRYTKLPKRNNNSQANKSTDRSEYSRRTTWFVARGKEQDKRTNQIHIKYSCTLLHATDRPGRNSVLVDRGLAGRSGKRTNDDQMWRITWVSSQL